MLDQNSFLGVNTNFFVDFEPKYLYIPHFQNNQNKNNIQYVISYGRNKKDVRPLKRNPMPIKHVNTRNRIHEMITNNIYQINQPKHIQYSEIS